MLPFSPRMLDEFLLMPNVRFSIIVPTFNGGEYARQCIQSVLAQTLADFQLSILDDGSMDGTVEWLQELSDARITIYPSEHLGIEDNWARACAIPKAEFMTILGQDDWLDPNYLTVMDSLTRRFPEATLYHAHFRFVGADSQILRVCRPLPERETAAQFLETILQDKREVYGTGYVMRSADYEAVGGIPPFEKLLFADLALWLSLMRRGDKVAASSQCFAVRLHPDSTTAASDRTAYLKASTQYLNFLTDLAAEDEALGIILARRGPEFFLRSCGNWYPWALAQATRENRRLDPAVLQMLDAALSHLRPDLPARLRRAPRAVWHGLVNRREATRRAYRAFARLRQNALMRPR